jgi:mannose-6-phosphate isomerase
VSDRPGDESVIANGPLQGRTLRWLMEQCPAALLGPRDPVPARFPLLIKIIDAQDTLSLQVHPPAAVAARLGGEPKTEMWYVARAEPAAALFAGLKKGVSRAEFERKLAAQTVAECIHRIPVREGDAMFLPSGRVHALGAGIVVFEVQQNSDTTYRVFDWNRVDRDGKARDLHVPQSLASIDCRARLPRAIRAPSVRWRATNCLPSASGSGPGGTNWRGRRGGWGFWAWWRGRCAWMAPAKRWKPAPGDSV